MMEWAYSRKQSKGKLMVMVIMLPVVKYFGMEKKLLGNILLLYGA
jgi:hypothetical protein